MVNGKQLVEILKKHIGETYVLGSMVPKGKADCHGPWDCAELQSWGIFQLTGRLYGCKNDDGNPNDASGDAYTGYWAKDARVLGKIISINDAAMTPGALLLRIAGNGVVGHIVCSQGSGNSTVEAHSHKDGVIQGTISGRRWDLGILIPWMEYTKNEIPNIEDVNKKPSTVIYRFTNPMMQGDEVRKIQTRLGVPADGKYGLTTFQAVRKFQSVLGLLPDGEVGPITLKAMGISL